MSTDIIDDRSLRLSEFRKAEGNLSAASFAALAVYGVPLLAIAAFGIFLSTVTRNSAAAIVGTLVYELFMEAVVGVRRPRVALLRGTRPTGTLAGRMEASCGGSSFDRTRGLAVIEARGGDAAGSSRAASDADGGDRG